MSTYIVYRLILFTRKKSYASTFVNLLNHKVFDIKLGQSESNLRQYLKELNERDKVQVVVMDMSETYRHIAQRYFPNAIIVANRFHVVRLNRNTPKQGPNYLRLDLALQPLRTLLYGILFLVNPHYCNRFVSSFYRYL